VIVSIEEKRLWNRWIWERLWIGLPSIYARSLGWVAPSYPYPAGFIPLWDFFVWRDFAHMSRMPLNFESPNEFGLATEHEGALVRQIDRPNDSVLIYKTIEEEYPYPPEWELVTIERGTKKMRRLGYFSKMSRSWIL
jgi:hypothetical protein